MSFNLENFVRAPFHHEVFHCWTSPTGPGSNFLREGWASFAETYVIRKKYGEEAEKKYLGVAIAMDTVGEFVFVNKSSTIYIHQSKIFSTFLNSPTVSAMEQNHTIFEIHHDISGKISFTHYPRNSFGSFVF